MPRRTLKRINQIRDIVTKIDFKDKGFQQALKYEVKQRNPDFNRLRHWINSDGIELYIEVWNNYKAKLKSEGVSSKVLIQSYHHIYVAEYNQQIFQHVVTYLNNDQPTTRTTK